MTKLYITLAGIGLSAALLWGCDSQTPEMRDDELSEAVGDAAEETREAADLAAQEAVEATDQAVDQAREAIEQTGDRIESATD